MKKKIIADQYETRSTRYPLQEICRQDNIQTNCQRIIDDYPNIYRTQQSGYPVPNEYIVGLTVNGVDLIAKTQYTSFGEVVYTITWDSCNEKKDYSRSVWYR
ncbi:hypothetical protein C2G38_2226851 [Gigaspora rosea]|uniref:Uncharacterized protein n=1 Tax=Gigaspora rosea TaxID=44941 RepID=A0A397U179_9GLOM|nr:hypothetical protein C2G38_2226851 [Gigaspora rosea]